MGQQEFSASQESVSMLYFQALIWCTMLYYPYIVIVVPILLYLRFKYTSYVLNVHCTVPKETSISPVTSGNNRV